MRRQTRIISLCTACFLAVTVVVLPLISPMRAAAAPAILQWAIVDTPSQDYNVVVSPSEVNRLALGPDSSTMYAVDIPNGKLYRSADAGVTWDDEVIDPLRTAGAQFPVWDVVIAPDDVSFVVVTDNATDPATDGPKSVFVTVDAGKSWQNTNLPALVGGEFISCLAISALYDINKRDIAIATRDGAGGGRVFVLESSGSAIGTWYSQAFAASDVVAMKFSPNYAYDNTLVVVYASNTGLYLNFGRRDTVIHNTVWQAGVDFPVRIPTSAGIYSPNNNQIITADLELPFDFSGADPGNMRHYFVSYDSFDTISQHYISRIYRVDDTQTVQLMSSDSVMPDPQRISSIAYWGSISSGKLIAGEVINTEFTPIVDIWRCKNPWVTSPNPGWDRSDAIKSPTGGAGSRLANAQVLWTIGGDRAYCATSSATLSETGSRKRDWY